MISRDSTATFGQLTPMSRSSRISGTELVSVTSVLHR